VVFDLLSLIVANNSPSDVSGNEYSR
jgi:hypothetical protein